MLQNNITSQMNNVVARNPQAFHLEVTFHQDGAPSHCFRDVRNNLDATYPERWIGSRGGAACPARSPDLTLLDLFLWVA